MLKSADMSSCSSTSLATNRTANCTRAGTSGIRSNVHAGIERSFRQSMNCARGLALGSGRKLSVAFLSGEKRNKLHQVCNARGAVHTPQLAVLAQALRKKSER
eukprot:8680073-Pyramimonas_sp.AAC.1